MTKHEQIEKLKSFNLSIEQKEVLLDIIANLFNQEKPNFIISDIYLYGDNFNCPDVDNNFITQLENSSYDIELTDEQKEILDNYLSDKDVKYDRNIFIRIKFGEDIYNICFNIITNVGLEADFDVYTHTADDVSNQTRRFKFIYNGLTNYIHIYM